MCGPRALEDRQTAQTQLWEPPRALTLLNLLSNVLDLCGTPIAASGEARLQSIGRQVAELGCLPWRDFEVVLRAKVFRALAQQVAGLERERSRAVAQSPWAEDLKRWQADLVAVLEQPDFLVPVLLRQSRSIEQARALVLRLITRYGQLIEAWPSLVAAAVRLRDRGEGLLRPLAAN